MNVNIIQSGDENKCGQEFCRLCKQQTNQWIRKEFHYKQVIAEDEHLDWEYEYKAQILQCCGCDTITFRLFDREISPSQHPNFYRKIFPPVLESSDIGTLGQMWEIWEDLPSNIQGIYQETLEAINSRLNILAAIGIRTIIETVCKDKKICPENTNLKTRIDKLKEAELVTAIGAKSLHALREFGNDATHDVKPLTPEQVIPAFTVIEHLLRELYILPSKARRNLGVQVTPAEENLGGKR